MHHDQMEESEYRRPLGLTLLTGLYSFFFMVSVSTFGNPFPFLGTIYEGTPAKALVFVDCLVCLYLVIGIMKRQFYTWHLLLAYNLFQVANTIINLSFITVNQLEKVVGQAVQKDALITNNIAAALAILLLTQFIYRHRNYFTNKSKYLF